MNLKHTCTQTQTHSQVDLSPAEYSMTSVTSEVHSEHLNVAFPKGQRKFIRRHNEHHSRHQSLMLTPSQDTTGQNKYVGQNKNTNTLSASSRDLRLKTRHNFLLQLTADTISQSYTPALLFYFIYPSLPSFSLTCLHPCGLQHIYSRKCQSSKHNTKSAV